MLGKGNKVGPPCQRDSPCKIRYQGWVIGHARLLYYHYETKRKYDHIGTGRFIIDVEVPAHHHRASLPDMISKILEKLQRRQAASCWMSLYERSATG